MNFRGVAVIAAVPFLAVPAQAQDRQAPISLAKVSQANVAPAKTSPAQTTPAKVSPAKISPAKAPTASASQTQAPQVQQAEVSQTEAPSFRRGLWRFIRTLDVVRSANKNIKYRVVDREMTRCVDPTHAMKTTFSSAPVGSCVSDKPEKVGNTYTFGHRCDYMGAVSTVITVHSDESYTEVNEVSTGDNPKTDLVSAKRIGDCGDEKAEGSAMPTVSSLQH